MGIAVATFLNGVSYGMVLFLVASGLSLTLGLMGIVNLAHGVVFILGGFVGLAVAKGTGSFLLAILAGAAASGIAGLIIERGFLRFLYKQDLPQVLVTFALLRTAPSAGRAFRSCAQSPTIAPRQAWRRS